LSHDGAKRARFYGDGTGEGIAGAARRFGRIHEKEKRGPVGAADPDGPSGEKTGGGKTNDPPPAVG